MRVLVVYAHQSRTSFCHAVLEQLTAGLAAAGHQSEVVDLYASKFNPVMGLRDATFFAHDTVPAEVVESMHPREGLLALSPGPIGRFVARRWLRGKQTKDIVRLMARFRPRDVLAQQAKLARADGLVLIAPVYWMGFPAILKGWIDRVFSYGFAYALTPEGWQGNAAGRIPLLRLKKALVLSTTFFKEADYQQGFRDAMGRIVDDWSLRYPGVQTVEHVHFFAPGAVGPQVRQEYLEHAYRLGFGFEPAAAAVRSAEPAQPEPAVLAH
jgi:NAD(P)H dehydrogenase (quinone)